MSVEWHGEDILREVRAAAFVGIFRATEQVRNTALAHIRNPPKTGKYYPRRGIIHQASAPGQAPATDTGRLAQSGRTSYDKPILVGWVIFSTKYAAALEFGTQHMAPRPFLRRSLDENRDFIVQAMQEEIAKVLGQVR